MYPALQVQAATAVLKLGELELPGHDWQVKAAVAPVEAEYFPAPHDVQVVDVVAAVAAEYVPAPHEVQVALPVVSL